MSDNTKLLEAILKHIKENPDWKPPKLDICGSQSPGDPNGEDEEDMPVTCSRKPGHQGKHAGGVRCGTVEWIDSKRWFE